MASFYSNGFSFQLLGTCQDSVKFSEKTSALCVVFNRYYKQITKARRRTSRQRETNRIFNVTEDMPLSKQSLVLNVTDNRKHLIKLTVDRFCACNASSAGHRHDHHGAWPTNCAHGFWSEGNTVAPRGGWWLNYREINETPRDRRIITSFQMIHTYIDQCVGPSPTQAN